MDETMLTEDIDSALRAFGHGANVVHDLNVTSFELAPTSWFAFWKQRLRWSQGWVQASIRHANLIWKPSEVEGNTRTLRQRFGLLSLLWVRESSYYLISQYLCLVFSIIITDFPKSGTELYKLVFFQYPVAWWLFILRYASLYFSEVDSSHDVLVLFLYSAHCISLSTPDQSSFDGGRLVSLQLPFPFNLC